MIMYGIFMPFNYIASSFFINKLYNNQISDESLHRAGELMALPFIVSGLIVPLIALWIDKYGYRCILLNISSITIFLSLLVMQFYNVILGLFLFGISFSIFAAVVWPSIALVVSEKYVGLALSITTSMQNLSMSLFPLIVAYIYSKYNRYDYVLIFFSFLSIIAILLSLSISKINKDNSGALDKNEEYFLHLQNCKNESEYVYLNEKKIDEKTNV